MSNDETNQVELPKTGTTPKYLLTEETFNRLRQAQETIMKETGFTPTFKKLVNDLLTPTVISELTEKYIERMKM